MHTVAIFLPSLAGGGAERAMLNLASGFVSQGIKVDLVLVKAEGSYLSQVPSGVRLVVLGQRRMLLSMPALARYLRQEQPIVMLCGQDDINVAALWVRQLARVHTRIVVSVHNQLLQEAKQINQLKRRLAPYLASWFYPFADAIVAVSQGLAEELASMGLPSERIGVIYNPVVTPELLKKAQEPLEHPWFSPNQPPVILSVGRLDKPKDFPTLIRAFAQVKQQRQVRLLILGEGPELPKLEALVREKGLTEYVAFAGFVANPYAYMARSAVCVLSSTSEGFGNVLVEAMSTGTPVISTNCKSGPAEILANGRYGKLVAVGDIEAMAQAIIRTLDEPINSMALQQRAMEFSLERALVNYLKVLQIK